MPAPTNAEIAYQMSGLLDRWTLFTTQLRDWLGGTADGGPNGDGAYPLQNVVGEVFLVPCPAANSAQVTDLTDPLEGVQATVDAGVTATQAAQAAAEQARDIALTYRDAAVAASGESSMYATNSANSAADALTSKNAAGTSATAASAAATAAATSETNAATSETNAAASETAAAGSADAANVSAQAASDYADQAQAVVTGSVHFIGPWDAASGDYPASPSKGDLYKIGTAGILGGVNVRPGDSILWTGTEWITYGTEDAVWTVAGKTGNVTVAQLQASLNLGTAAYQDTAAFATAAQGAKADSAVQPSALTSYMPKTGGAFSGGVSFGSVSVGLNPLDFSRHIALYGTSTGLSVSADGLNYAINGGVHSFYCGTTKYATLGKSAHVFSQDGTSGNAVEIITPNNLPWSLALTRSDLGSSAKLFWDGGSLRSSAPFTAPSVTDTSDERLKTNIRRDRQRWRGIRRKIEMVLYDRIGGSDDEPGVIAQEVQKVAPEFVSAGEDGILSVHYGKLALACALDPEPWT